MKIKMTLAMLAIGSALALSAQDAPPPPGGGQGRPGGDRPRMMNPIMAALDANGDGEIDAKEIENSAVALKKLDKNGDGKLTMDEIRPAGFGRGPGGPGGPGGQGGPGGPGGNRPPRPDGDRPPQPPQNKDK